MVREWGEFEQTHFHQRRPDHLKPMTDEGGSRGGPAAAWVIAEGPDVSSPDPPFRGQLRGTLLPGMAFLERSQTQTLRGGS